MFLSDVVATQAMYMAGCYWLLTYRLQHMTTSY